LIYLSDTDNNITEFLNALNDTGLETEEVHNMGQALYDKPPHNGGLNMVDINIDSQGIDTNVTLVYNSTAKHSLPILLNMVTNTLLKLVKPASTSSIRVSSRPWLAKNNFPEGYFDGGTFGSVMLVGMAMALVPGGFGIGAARDRIITKSKSQLRISGLTMNMYWFSAFLVDYLQYMIVAVASIVIMVAFQIPSIIQPGAIISLVLLYIFYMPVTMLFAYNMGFLFDNYETAESAIPNIMSWVRTENMLSIIIFSPLKNSINKHISISQSINSHIYSFT
jgi:ATP-binding cassette subfamily A (ABC1) protein 5